VTLQRVSNLIPVLLVGLLAWLGKPSWWAIAMLTGGAMFAWGWLWGDTRLLNGRYGLKVAVVGLVCLAAAWVLAQGLGIGLGEFHQLREGLRRNERLLYNLPAVGVGLILYGLIIWSVALSKSDFD
jgi:hypothetical protein